MKTKNFTKNICFFGQVMFAYRITLIKCLKGHKSPGSLFAFGSQTDGSTLEVTNYWIMTYCC